jgi:hypothetical protein
MKWFEDIYRFIQTIFEKLTFRTKHNGYDFLYDDDSGHTVYEYNFKPVNENNMDRL